MRFLFARGKIDLLDWAAAVLLGLCALFAVSFFVHRSASAAGSEEAFRAELRERARKKILKERAEAGAFLDPAGRGLREGAWEGALDAAGRFSGNSQFQVSLAMGYRERGDLPAALGAYRRALEVNRDYSDRRSEHYLGPELMSLTADARAAILGGDPGDGRRRAVADLFYIERSLAGGCH